MNPYDHLKWLRPFGPHEGCTVIWKISSSSPQKRRFQIMALNLVTSSMKIIFFENPQLLLNCQNKSYKKYNPKVHHSKIPRDFQSFRASSLLSFRHKSSLVPSHPMVGLLGSVQESNPFLWCDIHKAPILNPPELTFGCLKMATDITNKMNISMCL